MARNAFKKTERNKEKETFSETEIPRILTYLKSNADIWNLGLILQFQTGMRIGEIAALKPEDIKDTSIHVRRTEVTITAIRASRRKESKSQMPYRSRRDYYRTFKSHH